MFIETAFFRFNEALNKNAVNKFYFNEEQIRGLFGQSIVDELNSRTIPYPSLMVNFKKRYDISSDLNKNLLVDIFTNFSKNAFSLSLSNYGYDPRNWIEIKYLSSKSNAIISKTSNAARILKDILRLIILTGGKKNGKRYVLIITDKEPEKYFATKIKGHEKRVWLNSIFNYKLARNTFNIQLTNESSHFKKQIGNCSDISNISLSISTLSFVPTATAERYTGNSLLFYSFLVRIDDFEIKWDNNVIPASYDKETHDNCRKLAKIIWS